MEVLEYFNEITAIPHCSYDTKKLADFLVNYAKSHGFDTKIDDFGNIHAIKGEPKVCLQAHYDMVCVGNAPDIELNDDGQYLSAIDSSLGADNGIGVAICMKMMAQKNNLEVLWTNNEEVGMLGAAGFNSQIKSPNLLNLDSECDDEIIIGCAGGVLLDLSIQSPTKPSFGRFYEVQVNGLPGGHSGVEIHKNIPNAIKVLSEFLKNNNCEIISLNGGERNNSIPANASAVVLCAHELDTSIVNSNLRAILKNLALKDGLSDDSIANISSHNFINARQISSTSEFTLEKSMQILEFINNFKHGVYKYDEELNMPHSSANLAIISQKSSAHALQNADSQDINVQIYARAMDEEELKRIATQISEQARQAGFSVSYNEQSAPWQPVKNDFAATVLKVLSKHRKNAKITSIHAGLECGVLCANAAKNGKNLLACSIGPNIISPHSTHEKCEIASVHIITQAVDEIINKL